MSDNGGNGSREARVLTKHFSALCRAVTDPLQLSKDFYAEGLISKPFKLDVDSGRESPSLKRHQAAVKLLTAVDMSLSKDSTKLGVLILVLKNCLNDNGRAAEAIRAMEIEYGGKGEQFVSIQHARTVMMKHMNNIAAVMTDVAIYRIGEELLCRHVITEPLLEEIKGFLPVNGLNNDPEVENATKLLRNIHAQIVANPAKFAILIAVLKDDPSTDQNVVAVMEAEYCKSFII